MNTIERITKLLSLKGVTAKQMLSELEMSASAVTEWKKGKAKPSYGSIVKMARYFNVSESYLLCKTDDPTLESSPKNEELDRNVVKIIGRDGRYIEKRMTDEQIAALKLLIEQMPDAPKAEK